MNYKYYSNKKYNALNSFIVVLLFIYPLASGLPPIYANINWGDIVFLVGYLLIVLPIASNLFFDSLYSPYGALSLAFVICILSSTVISSGELYSYMGVAQLSVVFWLLVPSVVAGFRIMKSPLKMLEYGLWIYVLIAGVGMLIYSALGLDYIFYNSGNGRLFMKWNFGAFSIALLPYALHKLGSSAWSWKNFAKYGSMIAISLLVNFQADSRAGILSTAVCILVALILYKERLLPSLVCLAAGLLITGYFFDTRVWDRSDLPTTRSSFVADQSRSDAAMESLQNYATSIQSILFGTGWQLSGFQTSEGRVLVHNIYIQILCETGILSLFSWLAMLGLIVSRCLKGCFAKIAESQVALLIATCLLVGWMFHPLSTLREHWLAFAVLVGLAFRPWVRYDHTSTRRISRLKQGNHPARLTLWDNVSPVREHQ